jgi:predicted Zn-dependent protease with MMP-like domain
MELDPEGIVPPDVDPGAADAVVQRIEAMLDEEQFEAALSAIDEALASGSGNENDLNFLAGDALLATGRTVEAERRFRAVLDRDPDCPASRYWLAMSLFLQWRFDDAEAEAVVARAAPDALPDSHVVYGALIERKGRFAEADACFAKAAAADGERFPIPVRMSRAEFDREVRKAARKLPRQFRQCLDRVPVIVQDLPDASLGRGEQDSDVAPDMLGLFDGVPLPETAEFGADTLRPNTIYLFQRNLERVARDRDDLVEQIRITLWHELGHYLGFEEEDMDDLGLA